MKRIRMGLMGLALASQALLAQSYQFGGHAGFSIPMGDLSSTLDGRLGYIVGGHAGLYYGNGHELRPRIDYMHFSGGWQPEGDEFHRATVTGWVFGADYIFYPETRPMGVYLAMGVGLQSWNVDPEKGGSQSKTGLGISIGTGYRFNRVFSLETRFLTGQFQDNHGQANTLQFIGNIRF